jgi:cohesin complex subunit SA-1/2
LEIQDSIQNLSTEVLRQLKVTSNETNDEVDTQKAVIEKVITIGPTIYKLQMLGEQVDINEFIAQPNTKSVYELFVFKIFNRLDFEVIFTGWINNFLKVSDKFIDSFCKILDLVLVCTSWKLETLVSYDELNQKFHDVESVLYDDLTIVNQLFRMLESLTMTTKYITDTRGTSKFVSTSASYGKLMHLLNDMKTLIAAKVIDLTTSIKIFYVKFKNSNLFKNFDEFFDDLNFGKYINKTLSEKIQSELLDIFLYKETRLGKLLNIELERADDESVNYDNILEAGKEDTESTNESRFESDDESEESQGIENTNNDEIENRKKVWDEEKSLCVYTLKLISLIETSMIGDMMFERLKLNSEKLGEVYKTIMQQHIESMTKYHNEKDLDTQLVSAAIESEIEIEDVTESSENRNDNNNITTREQNDE